MNLNRRLFLRGLGGAAVAAPLLTSVRQRAAKAQGITVASVPRRLVVMFTHYGCLTDLWFPDHAHGELTADDFMGKSIEALAPHAAKILMPRGIRAMNEWTASASTGQGNDPHTQVVGTYFTCVPVTPHTNDPFSFDEETKFLAMPTAPSLDHVCARQLNASGIPLYLRVSGQQESPQTTISYSAGEEPFPGVGTAMEAFSVLTGLLGGDTVSADSYRALRGQSVLDIVKDDLETLERFDMSASDRQKLEAWKELLDQTGSTFASEWCNEDSAASLGLTDANFQVASEEPGEEGDRVTRVISGSLDYADLCANVAVLSALCDQSRVIFLKYPSNYIFRGLGIDVESHSLSHRIASATPSVGCLDSVYEWLETVDRYYAAKFAHLVAQLDRFEEGDGTLLDNTATVWFQEMSDGNQHNLNNMPLVQAGSCGGYFRTGRAVNVDDGDPNLSRGNSIGVCREGDTFDALSSGTPPEFGNARINKYYCNLMNAIGVKAGSDGFPAAGGSGEVTHYGMYDDTRDFASGGENPPNIVDPGEFSDLRANS